MKLSDNLMWRGLIKDKTFEDAKWLDKPQSFYWGVDCSSDSLTIGNLAPLIMARRFSEAGWKAVLLVGGATSLIGDPGGKDEERPLLPRETVQKNVSAIKKQVAKLFGGQDFTLVDNYDWFKDVGYLEFLREAGKHFSVTELIQRDFIAERIGEHGSGISYAEFSYSLVQGYDFWQLHNNHKVKLQIGGSDQWGNMLSGVALIRKKDNAEAHALSMPLVVDKTTGRKFGKSEAGAVWLDPDKTSVFNFYQFWLNISDEDAEDYLKVFTFLNKEEIEKLMKTHKQNPAGRLAQKQLAHEVTSLVHGQSQAEKQSHISDVLVGEGEIEALDSSELSILREEIPAAALPAGSSTVEALVELGLAASNSEARRLMESKAIYVNNEKFDKPHLDAADFNKGRLMLRRGKAYKDSALVELA
jgi:tyrosyl-tRNA synthetase